MFLGAFVCLSLPITPKVIIAYSVLFDTGFYNDLCIFIL